MSARSPSLVLLVARQELLLAARSRWTQIFAGAFAVLALGVSGSGYILSGGHGFQDFARTSASLVQLVVLVVPLASLLMGVLALAPERGTAELLFSQPISRRAILAGKLLGLLTACFLAIAALIAAGAVGRKRIRALALALVVWFVAVILLDLVALGVASLLPSTAASRLLIVSIIANPAGAVRTGALLGIEGTAAFGSASLALLRFTGGPARAGALLVLSVLAWIVLPAAAAARRLSRVDL